MEKNWAHIYFRTDRPIPCSRLTYIVSLKAERVSEFRFSGTRNQPKNGLKARPNVWFCKVPQHLQCAPLWKIKHLAKNEEKPCSTCLQSIFRPIPGSDFGYSRIPPLVWKRYYNCFFIRTLRTPSRPALNFHENSKFTKDTCVLLFSREGIILVAKKGGDRFLIVITASASAT